MKTQQLGYISGYADATEDFTESDRIQLNWELHQQRVAEWQSRDTRPTWRKIASHIYRHSELPKMVDFFVDLYAEWVRGGGE